MDLKKVKEEVKNRLSEKRYIHSVGTMIEARFLARMYGEDEEKAAFAGLIHDIAKELPKEKIYEYLVKYDIQIDSVEKNQMGLLHAKIGAVIAREEFGADKKIENAIKYHTTGNVKMNIFDKIIYMADKVEENRDYDKVETARSLAMEDLDKAILFMLDFAIQKSVRKQTLIHPDSVELRNKILTETIDK